MPILEIPGDKSLWPSKYDPAPLARPVPSTIAGDTSGVPMRLLCKDVGRDGECWWSGCPTPIRDTALRSLRFFSPSVADFDGTGAGSRCDSGRLSIERFSETPGPPRCLSLLFPRPTPNRFEMRLMLLSAGES